MKVLVIGGGGREHALAWKIARSRRVQRVYVAPGNGGSARSPGVHNVAALEPDAMAEFAASEAVDLTVVGPEAPLSAGIVDAFRLRGLPIFGPTRAAAQLEASKDFAKAFMQRHSIPTAPSRTFSDPAAARQYIRSRGAPIVIKADGLAAGKGVVVAGTVQQALDAVDRMLVGGALGAAGARVVVEDFLEGEEASFIVMSDGQHALALATSQDHKRLLDADEGPNTGGMGAYSPAPVVTPELHARVMRQIMLPAIAGMAADGTRYTGFLYAGLMIDRHGEPRTLEFNCRLGDPEAQPILMRLRTDLVELLQHAVDGRLDRIEASWDPRVALGVVVAAQGYPEAPRRGDPIESLPADAPDCIVFHAGTRLLQDRLVTDGGRVLCVTALGDDVRAARRRAYEAVSEVRFAGQQFRTDIGHRALLREPV
ncbi:MAG TPA: phosphoribosylamine--glycine ligase [Burkholderiaceae bacterium]|nr:phosphoribosylamine--glycine ligase [Burkholderiaceae bacterium]